MKSLICTLLVALTGVIPLHAQNSVVTYQGRVTSGGANFTGSGQFKFALVTGTNFSATATATAITSGGFVTIINVTFGGNGYVTPPAVTISGGGGSGAVATANLSSGVVTSVTVNNPGSGYTSVPTVTIAAPPENISYTTYWSNDGTSVAGSEPAAGVTIPVSGGLFTARLGDATLPNMMALGAGLFQQPNLQLRIWFNDGVHGFAVLSPTQPLTAAPYAMAATSANNLLGTLPANQLSGSLPSARVAGTYGNAVAFTNAGNTFSGNGVGLTNISANHLTATSTNVSITSWGWNDYGQRNIPAGLDDVVMVSPGTAHTLALRADGTVVAWGAGKTNDPSSFTDFGQSIVPVGLSNNVAAIAAGYLHSVALKMDGTVVAWGVGMTNDPLDDFDHGQSIVPAGLSNVVSISAGAFHSIALKNNGTVVAWGAGLINEPTNNIDYGQSMVPPGLNNAVAVSAGYRHSLALRSDGTVLVWGDNTFGQTNIPPGLNNVIAIAAGGVHSLALKNNGTVVAWGAGLSNNPVDGINFGQSIVPIGLSNVVAVAPGFLHSLVLKSDGTVVAWGANTYGQTNVPVGLNNILALSLGSISQHVLVLRKQFNAPVAWLDSDNTFNGNIQVNGEIHVGGELTAGNGFRLNDANMWLRGGHDVNNGLGWYGDDKFFANETPDGPVLFGSAGGRLGTFGTNGQQNVALSWDSSQRVGIGTSTPGARLSLGSSTENTKLLLRDDGDGTGAGFGALGNQLRLHLGSATERFSFLDAPNGNELMAVYGSGLGSLRMDVRGDIRLGNSAQFYAPGAEERLRIIRGRISAAGTITTGTGFTVTKTGTGAYTVTFSTAFSAEPTVTATPQVGLARIATCTNVGASSAQFRTFDSAGGAAVDQDFHFIIIGPR